MFVLKESGGAFKDLLKHREKNMLESKIEHNNMITVEKLCLL